MPISLFIEVAPDIDHLGPNRKNCLSNSLYRHIEMVRP
jgi:hypothetical protein